MPLPEDPYARRYLRVAHQRLDDGRLIVEQLNRPQAAIYLTGYAVECGLKSLLIERTPQGRRGAVVRSFRGASAHDLRLLRSRLLHIPIRLPRRIEQRLTFVLSWSTDLRYDPSPGDPAEADQFVASAAELVDWIERSF